MAKELQRSIVHRLAQEQLFRLQAKRVAAQAQNASNPKIKKALGEIAEQYLQLAESLARRPSL